MRGKIARIVTLAIVGVAVTVGWLYVARGVYRSFNRQVKRASLDASRSQCNSIEPKVSIAGCTAILNSPDAQEIDRTYAHFQRGLSYERKGDFDLAIQDDTLVILADPRMGLAYNNRGYAYERKGDLDRAIADFNQAIQLVPEQSFAWFNRGVSWSMKGEYLRAIDDFNRVVKLQPDNPMAWNNRCYYRAIAGQLDGALADCNRSLLLKPGVGETLDSRAFTYLKMKKYDLALADYNLAIGHNRAHAGWLFGRSLARKATRDSTGAFADRAAATALDPEIAQKFKKLGVP